MDEVLSPVPGEREEGKEKGRNGVEKTEEGSLFTNPSGDSNKSSMEGSRVSLSLYVALEKEVLGSTLTSTNGIKHILSS